MFILEKGSIVSLNGLYGFGFKGRVFLGPGFFPSWVLGRAQDESRTRAGRENSVLDPGRKKLTNDRVKSSKLVERRRPTMTAYK